MSYDPSHRKPPRQERWPTATPAEGWPSHRSGDPARGGVYAADQGGRPAEPGYRGHDPHHEAPSGSGYGSAIVDDRFRPGGKGRGAPRSYGSAGESGGAAGGYGWADNGYGADSGYQADFGHPKDYGYPSGYRHPARGSEGASYGYGYGGPAGGDRGTASGYAGATDGFAGALGTGWNPDGRGWAADSFAGWGGSRGAADATGAADPAAFDQDLAAPDVGVRPDHWRADHERRREAARRGLAVSMVTGVLAAAVAIGVSTLAAAASGSQASPTAAMGGMFVDRTPAAVRNLAAQHFGAQGRAVLLLGMYVAIAFVAVGIGLLTRQAAALGVTGIAGFSMLAAFVTITRPGSQVSDAAPSVAGGIAAVVALLWLVHASAPVGRLEHAHRGHRRRTR